MHAIRPALLLPVLALILSLPAQAQVTMAIGPNFGFDIGTCSITPEISNNVTKGGRFGLIFGVSFEVGFANMFYIASDYQYVQKGFSLSAGNEKESYSLNYLDLPVIFKVKFLHGKVRPYGLLGVDFAILLSATKTYDPGAGGKAQDTDYKDVFGSDFSLHFGGGAEFAVARNIGITGDVRYMLGLKSVYSNANQSDTKITPSGLAIVFGGLFYIR
jgi:opacity protein-like surface antigen